MNQKKLLIFMPSVEMGGGVEKNFFLISNNLSQNFIAQKKINGLQHL